MMEIIINMLAVLLPFMGGWYGTDPCLVDT